MSKPQKNKESNKRKAASVNYAKYSGMAFQMGATVFLGAFIGKKIDEHFATEKPYFTILLAIVGISASLYLILKDLIKDD